MNSRLRWKIVVTVVVTLGISIFAWYPLLADRYGLPNPGFIQEKRLRLGLDLKGGVQMVLRVNTDDAVLVETRNTAARLDEALTRQGVKRGPIEVLGPGRFRVADVAAERRRRRSGESRMTWPATSRASPAPRRVVHVHDRAQASSRACARTR